MTAGIIYIRVSSEEQIHGTSLSTQEDSCRRYCKRSGIEVAEIFRDEGESAKTADRPGLLAAIERARKKDVSVFIVWKLDRLSRNQLDFHTIRAMLTGFGVRVCSATEALSDDPAGKFLEGMLAAVAQFDNDVRAERTRSGMSRRVRDGWFVWRAPLGYRNIKVGGNPTLEEDPGSAPIIQAIFEQAADGIPQVDILAWLRRRGAKSTFGNDITAQALNKILRNPVYVGTLKTIMGDGEPIRGKWPPIVPGETWRAVQMRLRGTGGRRAWECQTAREDFPLRGYVHCSKCNLPLTASWNKGRHGKTYPYYRCRKCKGTTVRAERLEELFRDMLNKIRVDSWVFTILEERVRAAWEGEGGRIRERRASAERVVWSLTKKREALLDLYLAGKVDRETYDRKASEIAEGLALAQMEETDSAIRSIDLTATIEQAIRIFRAPGDLWLSLTLAGKRQLEGLIFTGPPLWNGTRVLNPHINRVILALRQNDDPNSNLVAPIGESLNPYLSNWLENINKFSVFNRGHYRVRGEY